MRVDDATQERAVGGWRAERAVSGWRAERAVAAGQEGGEQQKLAWKNGQGQSRPDTEAERRGSMG